VRGKPANPNLFTNPPPRPRCPTVWQKQLGVRGPGYSAGQRVDIVEDAIAAADLRHHPNAGFSEGYGYTSASGCSSCCAPRTYGYAPGAYSDYGYSPRCYERRWWGGRGYGYGSWRGYGYLGWHGARVTGSMEHALPVSCLSSWQARRTLVTFKLSNAREASVCNSRFPVTGAFVSLRNCCGPTPNRIPERSANSQLSALSLHVANDNFLDNVLGKFDREFVLM
jgi:hypothetical protein